jgi:hypothetical protein
MKNKKIKVEEPKISLELSKLLVQKGWEFQSSDWWVETLEHELDIPRSGPTTFPSHKPRILGHEPAESFHIVHGPALTQSSLRNYILNSYKIHIEISLIDNSREYYFEYTIISSKERDYNDKDMMDSARRYYNINKYSTYPEALDEALTKAISMIKTKV